MRINVQIEPKFMMSCPGTPEELHQRCMEASEQVMSLSHVSEMISMLRGQVAEGHHLQVPDQFYCTLAVLDDALRAGQPRTMDVIDLCETVANAAIRSQIPVQETNE